MRTTLPMIKKTLSTFGSIFAVVIPVSLLLSLWLGQLLTTINGQEKASSRPKTGAAVPSGFDLSVFGPDGLSDLTEEQKSKLFSGEIIFTSSPEVRPGHQTVLSAALLFPRPVEKVWAVLSATERQVDYLDEIEELKTIERAPDHNKVEFLVRVMGQKVRYTVVHHFVPEEYYFWWELDRSVHNDLKELFGFWKLYYAGDKTVGRYGSYVRPDFALPGFLRSMVLRSNIKLTLEKVRNFIESGENEKR